jgi:DNA invertase Pin-like site-specific DNA recombinase
LENNVRFIAINDGIDSAAGENEMMGFKNVINEFYARDMSKKIKSVKANQAKNGKRIGGKPPFGYMVDPDDKHHNIINPETAPIARRMFEMAANGDSLHSIAKTFTLEKIPTPLDWQNGTYTGIEWGVSSIHRMLRNREYLGYMIYNKQPKPSFKSAKRIVNDESQWIFVPDQHEPLVDEEL